MVFIEIIIVLKLKTYISVQIVQYLLFGLKYNNNDNKYKFDAIYALTTKKTVQMHIIIIFITL
jgi:hypothetical protein